MTKSREIEILDILKVVYIKRRLLLKVVGVFTLFGLLIALVSPKEYRAYTVLLPQNAEGSGGLGSLGGIASLAGISLGNGPSESLPLSAYPMILNSNPFRLELLDTKLKFETVDSAISFKRYYEEVHQPSLIDNVKNYTIGLPGRVIKTIRGSDDADIEVDESIRASNGEDSFWSSELIQISRNEKELMGRLSDQAMIVVNSDDGIVTLSAIMPSATAAADLVKRMQELLQKAVTDFKISKATDQLDFIQKRYREKEIEFEAIQIELAQYRDANRNYSSAVAQTESNRLQSQYDLIFGVYSELAQQVESARIKVKEDTPVFSVLEPVSVPLDKHKPKRLYILFTWIFFGFVVGSGFIFFKEFLRAVKAKW